MGKGRSFSHYSGSERRKELVNKWEGEKAGSDDGKEGSFSHRTDERSDILVLGTIEMKK